MTGYNLDDDQDREDRRKHLELASKVIDRMAGASAAAKGWSITVAGAAFGVAVVRSSWFIFLLGVGALVVFGYLDGQYLHVEKKYRDLYAAVVDNDAEPLSMDTSKLKASPRTDGHRSWSVAAFYAPLAIAGLILMAVSICRVDRPGNDSPDTPTQMPTTSSANNPASQPANPTSPSSQRQAPTRSSVPTTSTPPDTPTPTPSPSVSPTTPK